MEETCEEEETTCAIHYVEWAEKYDKHELHAQKGRIRFSTCMHSEVKAPFVSANIFHIFLYLV